MCKKVLLANKIAVLADYYFDGIAAGNNYSCIGLWIGSIAYTLQLYFDFSGYSDMAVPSLREQFTDVYVIHRANYTPDILDDIHPEYLIDEYVERYSSSIGNIEYLLQ